MPPNCPVCGLITKVAGAALAVGVVQTLGTEQMAGGLAGLIAVSLAAGKVGGDLANTVGASLRKD